MRISELTPPKNIKFLEAENKEDLFKKIADLFSKKILEVSGEDILLLLTKREKMGSTYAGNGFAIPHIKCKKIKDFFVFLFILKKEIQYDKEKKINYVFFVAGPDKDYSKHLSILSRIARMLKETNIEEKIGKENSPESISKIIEELENKII